jgi:hypothetical protein
VSERDSDLAGCRGIKSWDYECDEQDGNKFVGLVFLIGNFDVEGDNSCADGMMALPVGVNKYSAGEDTLSSETDVLPNLDVLFKGIHIICNTEEVVTVDDGDIRRGVDTQG